MRDINLNEEFIFCYYARVLCLLTLLIYLCAGGGLMKIVDNFKKECNVDQQSIYVYNKSNSNYLNMYSFMFPTTSLVVGYFGFSLFVVKLTKSCLLLLLIVFIKKLNNLAMPS